VIDILDCEIQLVLVPFRVAAPFGPAVLVTQDPVRP
jgi:hypothetical protein